jgi:hemerythrin superfamily protein
VNLETSSKVAGEIFKAQAMPSINNEPRELPATVLTDDHSEIDTLASDLLAALEDGDKLKVFARLDLLWARLAVHIRAEHLCLFPSILEANFSHTGSGPTYQEAQGVIDQLQLDHEFFMRELGTSVNGMRKQQDAATDDAVRKQFRKVRRSVSEIQIRLAKHNQLEENHVYKWVNVLLDEAEQSVLVARIRSEIENIPPRFSF